ncbi:uncharacterized protein LOC106345247 isoform X2 [Brassica napus]|uniref:uncharacterized protein LOC106345247 isoform X2 n=1 Tax=Brassica napus TaxID=3708 RepID=UPI0006AA7290|nr:uncharacterized protein LOC106345247 isoform X2 [Brassica napus]
MSTKIRMALVVNLLSLLFSTVIIHFNQNTVPLRSFKISENVTYDCIDIYKQPGLQHPFLKTHKIQKKSSVSRPELKMQTGKNETSNKRKIVCPNDTVPILRNTKEYVTNSQMFAEKHFHPLSADSPGTHIAGVRSSVGPFRGVQAWFSGNSLNVGKDQVSYSHIYIGSGSENQVNYISAGWIINPGLYGDQRVWTFGFWKGKDGKGCYNTACSGFVQVSKVIPIVEPYDLKTGVPGWMRYSIHQDKNTGNWWITQLMKDAPNEDIGYWPKELFNLLDNGANMVGVGGVVQASRSGLSPPMGNGNLPNAGRQNSGIFTNIEVLNSNYKQRKMNSFRTENLLDSDKCYGLRIGTVKPFHRTHLGFFFNYGGPGGISCGV